jgi:hypothetical protein
MKNIIYFFIVLFFSSCMNYRRIDITSHNISYSIHVPKGYYPVNLIGGHNEIEKQFIYADSSKIYISDLGCSGINYSNISSLGDSILKAQCDNIEFKVIVSSNLGQNYKLPYSIISGKDSQGFYWKDIRNGYVNVGYKGVSEDKKKLYDKYILP